MAGPILLPTPVAAKSFTLGQLVSDPLHPSSSAFLSTSAPDLNRSQIEPQYRDIISHDDDGRFVSSASNRSLSAHDSLLLVQADNMEYTSLKSPMCAFDAIRQDTATQTYLRKAALRHQPLYYVVGLQKLKNPTFKRAVVKEGSITEAKADQQLRLPMHVRRDSAMDLEDDKNDAVVGLEVRKVRCRLGPKSEPHAIGDIGYSWSYHALDADEDLQLAIGLGETLQAAELRAMAGIVSDEDFTDDSYEWDSDDEGQAGF